MKANILFILHMPPPVHGAAMVGKYIHDSHVINETFNCHYFNLTLARDLNDIGKGGIKKLFDFIKQLICIWKAVRKVNPQLCYVTPNAKGGAFYKDFIVIMLLKIMKQKIIIHYHNKGVATRQNKILDNFLYRQFFKNLKVILLAEVLYEDIKKYVPRKDVFFCPNGIPDVKDTIIYKKHNHTKAQILFLSNMIASKGVWELVKACSLLKESGVDFKCHFVGKWNDITEKEFNIKIHQQKLEDYIIAHGAKYGKDKIQFFQNTDIFVFPTYYPNECFPIVLLEAMQQGLPCISTNEGGIPNIIDQGKTGFVIEKNDPQQIADKINYLINHQEVCKQMGENGYKKYQKEFTLNTFENRLKDILIKCCDKTLKP